MTRLRVSREWAVRLGGALLLGVLGFVASVLLDFEPVPWSYAVMVLLACSVAWLAIDTIGAQPARWLPGLPPPRDRNDDAGSDLRILSSHHSATQPTELLRDRLVALARGRDPALAEAIHDELTPIRRLKAAEIDRLLTRIEESRDHS